MPDLDEELNNQPNDEELDDDAGQQSPPQEAEDIESPEGEESNDQPEEDDDGEIEEEEKPPSRREQLRIQQVLSKLNEKQEQAKVPDTDFGLKYEEELDADEGVIARLDKDRRDYGAQLYNQGLEQAKAIRFHTRLELDAPKVEAKYPALNKESTDFNPALADTINSWYLNTVGFNPKTQTVQNDSVRYNEFVEGIMELADEAANHKVSRTTQNIKQQAATTGLRPDGSKAKRLDLNKAPQAMSDEELDAFLDSQLKK